VSAGRQDIRIDEGNTIEVEGPRVAFLGDPAMVVEDVKQGGEGIDFREERDMPVRSGG